MRLESNHVRVINNSRPPFLEEAMKPTLGLFTVKPPCFEPPDTGHSEE